MNPVEWLIFAAAYMLLRMPAEEKERTWPRELCHRTKTGRFFYSPKVYHAALDVVVPEVRRCSS